MTRRLTAAEVGTHLNEPWEVSPHLPPFAFLKPYAL